MKKCKSLLSCSKSKTKIDFDKNGISNGFKSIFLLIIQIFVIGLIKQVFFGMNIKI